jgi:hypothetical protein
MSGIVDAGTVPSIEKDTTTTAPSSSAVEDLKTSVADSEVNTLFCTQIPSSGHLHS